MIVNEGHFARDQEKARYRRQQVSSKIRCTKHNSKHERIIRNDGASGAAERTGGGLRCPLYLSSCFSANGEWAFLFLFRDSCAGLEVIQVLPAMK